MGRKKLSIITSLCPIILVALASAKICFLGYYFLQQNCNNYAIVLHCSLKKGTFFQLALTQLSSLLGKSTIIIEIIKDTV